MNSRSKYTFGDTDRAAERLHLLARTYEEATRAFLSEHAPRGPQHAVDLGCGPGHTTRLLHEICCAEATSGVDSSARYAEMARVAAPPAIRFVMHDVARAPYPIPPADLVFCRHLLTHLADPRAALLAVAQLAREGALLLIQETEILEASDATLARYYECVSAMQAAHGQRTQIGAHLEAACAGTPFRVESSSVRMLAQDPRMMARLHRMNLATWRSEPRAAALFEPAELDELDAGLGRLEAGLSSAEPVRNGLRELVLRRMGS